MINFTKDTYFNSPTQIEITRVSDKGNVDTFIGIGYGNQVCCLCYDTIVKVRELEEDEAVYKVLETSNS